MKLQEKQEARRLRREEGLSLREISKKINVSKGSVSLWVRDIELTKDQIENLALRCPNRYSDNGLREKYLEIRKKYQEGGRLKARENNLFHMSGCMLYWAEGAKRRNDLIFCNSDVEMMKFFAKFLKKFFLLENENFCIYCCCYDNNNISVEDIENFWLNKLDLPRSCLRKTIVNRKPNPVAGRKIGKLPYGVCSIQIHKTEIVHHIYGAIQEYAGFDREKWLF